MGESFYKESELEKLGFRSIGVDVKISKKSSIYFPENITLGSHVRIDDFSFISAGKEVKIGNYVHIATYSAIYGSFGVEIHDYVNVSSRVNIFSSSDDYSGECMTGPLVPRRLVNVIGAKVVLEKHSIIGCGSIILPGVIVKEGTAIGALSIVKNSTEEYGVYAGIPVKKIKNRKRKMLISESEIR